MPVPSALHVSDDVRSVIDADGAVLLDLRGGRYYSLNGLGAEIWKQIESGRRLPEIEAGLADAYDVPASRLRADIEAFVGELTRMRLVRAGG
jgi:hypothetical protein